MKRRQRRRASVWQEAARLFSFKEIEDTAGRMHVVWAHSPIGRSGPVNVRAGECTEFEALENHEHLLDDIESGQFRELLPSLDSLCRAGCAACTLPGPKVSHMGAYSAAWNNDAALLSGVAGRSAVLDGGYGA